MDQSLQQAILEAWRKLPSEIRNPTASKSELADFEEQHGPIPAEYRWFLENCGGGPVGAEYVDDIKALGESHRKFRAESGSGGWTMRDVFIIGWDGAGNPFGIENSGGRILVEDHNFGGIHELAVSLEAFLHERLLKRDVAR